MAVDLVAEVAKYARDPLGFVLFAFDWGHGELVGQSGPRPWQRQVLDDLGKRLRGQAGNERPIRKAIVSGNGIGKSVLVAWLTVWSMSTMADCRVVVTANTAKQLETKTWPEIIKWHRRMINADWFNATATALAANDPAHTRTWRADAVPWSPTNTEAFAGLHNQGRRITIIYDEASGIDDIVWDVTEGALTDTMTEIMWFAFGNYTRNTGRFDECFQARRELWAGQQIDSRTVEGVSKELIAEWAKTYGEHSDFFCARVSAERPQFGTVQFINGEMWKTASIAMAVTQSWDPVVMGLDVARFGDDESVLTIRRGRDARTIPQQCFKGLDAVQLVGQVVGWIHRLGGAVEAIFIDATGVGGPVADFLRRLGYNVIDVNNGSVSDCHDGVEPCANKAAECACRCREWMRTGGAISDELELKNQLTNREYSYDAHSRIVLESKKDMKKRGLSSPDRAESLFLTFAYPVAARHNGDPRMQRPATQGMLLHDYEPLDAMR